MVAITETPPTEKEGEDSMDWEWTPKPLPIPDLAIDLKNHIQKGKNKYTPSEDPMYAADRAARSQRGGTVPPPTLTSKNGSGSSAIPKKRMEPVTGGNQGDSFDNSDSDASNNSDELPKKKLTSEDLLYKLVKAMAQNYKRRDKADAHKPQPYKGNPEDLERFIR